MNKENNIGVILKLEPQKKYVMLIEPGVLSINELQSITMNNGEIIVGKDITKKVKFIEHSNNIVGIKPIKQNG